MRAIVRTFALILIGAGVVLLLGPCAARAETFPLTGGSGSASINNTQFSPDHLQATSTGGISFTAHVTSGKPSGTCLVTFTLNEINTDHSTGRTLLGSCSDTWNLPSDTVACAVGSAATTVGKDFEFKISSCSLGVDGEGSPWDWNLSSYSVTTVNTMLFCPTAGSTCTCGGICNANACGTQFTTATLSDACSCDCTVAGCTGLSIAAPGSFTCTDVLNGNDCSLTWSTVPGTTNYIVRRPSAGSTIYTGATASFLDTGHGVGMQSYDVKANGSCPPSPLPGTTLSSKDSSLATLAACPVQSRGGIVSIR